MEEPLKAPETPIEPTSFIAEHRFVLLLGIAVVISIGLTIVSMTLYAVSGTAQLDLSRPGYQSVSNKVDKETKIDTYSASGSVNKDSIQEFMKLYDEQSKKAKAVDAFNGDPLNPELLVPDGAGSE